jgi:hypothetical protein
VTNTLNRKGLGKWTVDREGRLDYVLELPYTRRTTPSAFAHSLSLALGTLESLLREPRSAGWKQGTGLRRNRRKHHHRNAERSHNSKTSE